MGRSIWEKAADHPCQDTLYAMIKLKEKGALIDFQNISAFSGV